MVEDKKLRDTKVESNKKSIHLRYLDNVQKRPGEDPRRTAGQDTNIGKHFSPYT